jgi:hypothetical protein
LVVLREKHASNAELTTLVSEATDRALGQVDREIDRGRCDLAAGLLAELERLGQRSLEVQDRRRFLEDCRRAADCIDRGVPRQAVEILRRLSGQRPSATWLTQGCEQAAAAADQLEQLRGGPLGGLLPVASPVRAGDDVMPAGAPAPVNQPAPMAPDAGPRLPRQFMIRVDGVGSYFVLRDRRVTIGPAGSSRHPDVGLLADANVPTAAVERSDEDYFLSCDAPIAVNDVPVHRKLLASGDKIALSSRCRLKFVVPNAASTSAVLNLSGTRLPRGDARRVILLDRAVIIGPGPSAHIRADQLAAPTVLHVRDDRLFVRSDEEVNVNDRAADRHQGIPLGANVRVGTLSFVVTRA